jgi:hypothetical protein
MRLALLGLAALAATAGCQNNRAAVIPAPNGMLNRPDVYYTPPAGASTSSPGAATAPAVSLAPQGKTTSSTKGRPQDTYDVKTRVAADSQPIRVIDSSSRSASSANLAGGMPVNDGTSSGRWQTGANSTSVAGRTPFGGLRGASSSQSSSFSSQDGQWRSRSSYEGTERR